MFKNFLSFSLLAIVCMHQNLTAQIRPGARFPERRFDDVRNYHRANFKFSEVAPKWTLVNFWTMGCVSSIRSIPKMFDLQRRLGDKLQVILISRTDTEQNQHNKQIFDRFVSHYSGNVVGIFDPLLFNEAGIESVPDMYIIDPTGIVRFRTPGSDITVEKLNDLFAGRETNFRKSPEEIIATLAPSRYDSIFREPEILFSSVLSKWVNEYSRTGTDIATFETLPDHVKAGGFNKTMTSLKTLYAEAYFGTGLLRINDTLRYGKVWPEPVLEISDTSPFRYDHYRGVGLYNYHFKAPPAFCTAAFIQSDLKQKLETVFGYDVSIEEKMVPVWKIVIVNPEKAKKWIRPDNDKEVIGDNPLIGLSICDTPLKVVSRLLVYLSDEEQRPILDETGIPNILVKSTLLITDLNNVRKDLQKHGFDLVAAKSRMDTIVIRDADRS